MFLRNLEEYNHNTGETSGRLKLLKLVLFTLVFIVALIASSLTESESAPLLSKGSWISNSTAGVVVKVKDNY
jgi:hypothetical protein